MDGEYRNLNGISLAFPSRPELDLELVNLELPESRTIEVDDTDLLSTIRRSIAVRCGDAGEMLATIRFRPGNAIPVGYADETIVIILPVLPGQPDPLRLTFTGHIAEMHRPHVLNDDRCIVDIRINANSDLKPPIDPPPPITPPTEIGLAYAMDQFSDVLGGSIVRPSIYKQFNSWSAS